VNKGNALKRYILIIDNLLGVAVGGGLWDASRLRATPLGRLCDKGKPVVRRGTQSYGPLSDREAAGLPNRAVQKRRGHLSIYDVLSDDAIGGASLLLQATLPPLVRQLKRAMGKLQQALEEVESAIVEFEEALGTESLVLPVRWVPPERYHGQGSTELLSIEQVCEELGMGKSWVYHRIKSGEIPSVKLGRNIKVKREDLDQYLENQRYQPSGVA
jgi:excisionase family DNA binding protein